MTSESSEPDDLAWHREMDRAGWEAFWSQFDDEPTHEKWRRGAKWR
jgi:hypothetical protein